MQIEICVQLKIHFARFSKNEFLSTLRDVVEEVDCLWWREFLNISSRDSARLLQISLKNMSFYYLIFLNENIQAKTCSVVWVMGREIRSFFQHNTSHRLACMYLVIQSSTLFHYMAHSIDTLFSCQGEDIYYFCFYQTQKFFKISIHFLPLQSLLDENDERNTVAHWVQDK